MGEENKKILFLYLLLNSISKLSFCHNKLLGLCARRRPALLFFCLSKLKFWRNSYLKRIFSLQVTLFFGIDAIFFNQIDFK